MAVYQIRINEKKSLGKSLVTFLQSIPQVVTFEKPNPKSEIYHSLDRAFADVRLMLDEEKREKTLEELINELPDNND